jgi:hypothetical protein
MLAASNQRAIRRRRLPRMGEGAEHHTYRVSETRRLVADSPDDEVVISPDMKNFKAAKWRLAFSLAVQAQMDYCALESELHALERVPTEGRGKPAQFIPIRFVFTNKLGNDDKLVLAFDAFALSRSLGREISLGKIIHGDDHATLKVKTSALTSEVRKVTGKIASLLSSELKAFKSLALPPKIIACCLEFRPIDHLQQNMH